MICTKCLRLCAYKMQFIQHIKPVDHLFLPDVCDTCLYLCMGECMVLSHVTENLVMLKYFLLPQILKISSQVFQQDGML